jgi:glycerol kinase
MSVCYQTRDLVEAIAADGAVLSTLRVDGGMVKNNYVLQKLADVLDAEVHRPEIIETTALGAAYMAGLQLGLFSSLEEISEKWQLQQAFKPAKDASWREQQYQGWQDAVARTRSQG